MATDQEYLAEAGIDAETGAAVTSAETTAASTPTEQAPQTEQQKAVEMFEVSGQRYPVDTKFKITHGGKVLEVPYNTLANTYRQWSHMQDKWNTEYKPKITEFEKLRPEFDKYKGFYDKYGQLQTWSEQNPEDWNVLWDLYQNRDKHVLAAKAGAQGQAMAETQNNPNLQPLVETIAQLKQELGDLRSFKSSFEQEQQKKQELADTEMIQGEVNEFKKSYPEINLDEKDPDGVTLWAKVMKFGVDNRLPTFKAAANLYFEERLRDVWSTRARTETVKGFQSDRQAGVLKRSASPITGQSAKPINLKGMSYAEIAEMAKNGHFQEAATQ